MQGCYCFERQIPRRASGLQGLKNNTRANGFIAFPQATLSCKRRLIFRNCSGRGSNQPKIASVDKEIYLPTLLVSQACRAPDLTGGSLSPRSSVSSNSSRSKPPRLLYAYVLSQPQEATCTRRISPYTSSADWVSSNNTGSDTTVERRSRRRLR